MNEDQIHDRDLNRHLDQKYQADTQSEAWRAYEAQRNALEQRKEAIMDYFTVMENEPWQETLFGVIDNFQLTSAEAGAMVKAWIDRREK